MMSVRTKYGWVIACVALLGLVLVPSNCISAQSDTSSTVCSSARVLLPGSSLATHIVLGEVVDKNYSGSDRRSVHTYVELSSIQVLKGQPDERGSCYVIKHWGGVVEDGTLDCLDLAQPRFSVGDTALVFLSGIEGESYYKVVGAKTGKYEVLDGIVARGALKGLKVDDACACLRALARERSPEVLASKAALVCRGGVVSQETSTADTTGAVHTLTVFEISEVIKGDPDLTEVVIQQVGDIADRGRWEFDNPILVPGREYVLFLSPSGQGRYLFVGGYGGIYRISEGRVLNHDWPLSLLRTRITGGR